MSEQDEIAKLIAELPEPTKEQLAQLNEFGDLMPSLESLGYTFTEQGKILPPSTQTTRTEKTEEG